MDKIAAVILSASVVLSGCHLLFPFEAAEAPDSTSDAVTDGGSEFMADGLMPDAEIDSLDPDSLVPDTQPPPDTLVSPDTTNLCTGVTCGVNAVCKLATGKCECKYGYGPAYPTCNPLDPNVTVVIKCNNPIVAPGIPCKSGSTIDVDVTHTNAVSCTVWVECVDNAACQLAPTRSGLIFIPPSTTKAKTHTFTVTASGMKPVKWELGSPYPADVRFQATCDGVNATQVNDNKSIALSP